MRTPRCGDVARTGRGDPVSGQQPDATLASALTKARTAGGAYIAWREHVIDDAATGASELQGGDGLVMADLDKDGYLDIVSVHESDSEYDNNPDGLIRIAFGSADPDRWTSTTLASGKEAAAPEDVAARTSTATGISMLSPHASSRISFTFRIPDDRLARRAGSA